MSTPISDTVHVKFIGTSYEETGKHEYPLNVAFRNANEWLQKNPDFAIKDVIGLKPGRDAGPFGGFSLRGFFYGEHAEEKAAQFGVDLLWKKK